MYFYGHHIVRLVYNWMHFWNVHRNVHHFFLMYILMWVRCTSGAHYLYTASTFFMMYIECTFFFNAFATRYVLAFHVQHQNFNSLFILLPLHYQVEFFLLPLHYQGVLQALALGSMALRTATLWVLPGAFASQGSS